MQPPVARTCTSGSIWVPQVHLSRPCKLLMPSNSPCLPGAFPKPRAAALVHHLGILEDRLLLSLHTGPLDPTQAQACSTAAAQSTQIRVPTSSLLDFLHLHKAQRSPPCQPLLTIFKHAPSVTCRTASCKLASKQALKALSGYLALQRCLALRISSLDLLLQPSGYQEPQEALGNGRSVNPSCPIGAATGRPSSCSSCQS